jgi:hypothetical protein
MHQDSKAALEKLKASLDDDAWRYRPVDELIGYK